MAVGSIAGEGVGEASIGDKVGVISLGGCVAGGGLEVGGGRGELSGVTVAAAPSAVTVAVVAAAVAAAASVAAGVGGAGICVGGD